MLCNSKLGWMHNNVHRCYPHVNFFLTAWAVRVFSQVTDSSPLNAFGKLSHSDSYLWFSCTLFQILEQKEEKKKDSLGNLVSFFPKHTCCTNFNLQANWHGQKKSEGRESCVVKADISLWQGSAFLFPAPMETLQCILKRHHARDDLKGDVRICTEGML